MGIIYRPMGALNCNEPEFVVEFIWSTAVLYRAEDPLRSQISPPNKAMQQTNKTTYHLGLDKGTAAGHLSLSSVGGPELSLETISDMMCL